MGEVHRARDTRLDRTDARKVLPVSLAGDRSSASGSMAKRGAISSRRIRT
jgi:hypothetical protein